MRMMFLLAVCFAFIGLCISPASAQSRDDMLAQRELGRMASCLANRRGNDAKALYSDSYGQSEFDRLMGELVLGTEGCFPSGTMKLDPVAISGALAEALILKEGESRLTLLSMSVLGEAPPAPTTQDAVALCIVRGAPHLAAKLLETGVATSKQQEAITALQPVLGHCIAQSDDAGGLQFSEYGFRSIVAIAAYRQIIAHESNADA